MYHSWYFLQQQQQQQQQKQQQQQQQENIIFSNTALWYVDLHCIRDVYNEFLI